MKEGKRNVLEKESGTEEKKDGTQIESRFLIERERYKDRNR